MIAQFIVATFVVAASAAQQLVTDTFHDSGCSGSPAMSQGLTIGTCLKTSATDSVVYEVVMDQNGKYYNVSSNQYWGSTDCSGETSFVQYTTYIASCNMAVGAAQTTMIKSYLTDDMRPWSSYKPGRIMYTWGNKEDCDASQVVPNTFAYTKLDECSTKSGKPVTYHSCTLNGNEAYGVTYNYADGDMACKESYVSEFGSSLNSCFAITGGTTGTETCIV